MTASEIPLHLTKMHFTTMQLMDPQPMERLDR